jgi:hypothetical protein
MKNPVTAEIKPAVNLVYNEVKRKLEDTKTVTFIILMTINVFLWGLFLAEYREIQRDLETLQDKHDVTQVYLNQLKADKNE